MPGPADAAELAALIGGELSGDGKIPLSGISDLKNAKKTDVSFMLSKKHLAEAEASQAPVIISDSERRIRGKSVILVKSARHAYIKAVNAYNPEKKFPGKVSDKASVSQAARIAPGASVDDFAVVREGASIGAGVSIGAGAYIGVNVKVGDGSKINPNVTVYDGCEIGGNCIIHSGAVIGADGFGFVSDGGVLLKVPQIGRVKIGNNVEIGANCTIDRASFGATVISDGVKIDNLCQIAHNVEIGENTIIVSQAGIAGSTVIGKNCIIGGQVGIVDHVNIGDGAKIGSQAGIPFDVEPGAVITGTPAKPVMQLRKAESYMMKLEGLFKRVKDLEKKQENK